MINTARIVLGCSINKKIKMVPTKRFFTYPTNDKNYGKVFLIKMKNRLNNEIKYEDKYDKFGFIIINLFTPKLIDQLKLELEKKIIKKTNNENLYKKNNNF